MTRRWRGTIDVPLTGYGREQAKALRRRIGKLDVVYYHNLSRCRETAAILRPGVMCRVEPPRPWNMGEMFEGREITEESLKLAQHYIEFPYAVPPKGEPFSRWSSEWRSWLLNLDPAYATIGVVTHNRSIQHAIAMNDGCFDFHAYDCKGPDFCSIYHHRNGRTAEWLGDRLPAGIFLIRHGETEWGT